MQEKERHLRQSEREVASVERTLHLQQHEMSELRSSNENLRQVWSARDLAASRGEQQILYLKSKLKKAQSILAEMNNQSSNNSYPLSESSGSGDHAVAGSSLDTDGLRRELVECRHEIQILRNTAPMSTQDFVTVGRIENSVFLQIESFALVGHLQITVFTDMQFSEIVAELVEIKQSFC